MDDTIHEPVYYTDIQSVDEQKQRQWFKSGAILTRSTRLTNRVKDLQHAFVHRALISSKPCELAHSDPVHMTCSVWLACSSTPYFLAKIYKKCRCLLRNFLTDSAEMQFKSRWRILCQTCARVISGYKDEVVVKIGQQKLRILRK